MAEPYALFNNGVCIAAGPDVATGRRLRQSLGNCPVLVWGVDVAEGFKPEDLYAKAAKTLYASQGSPLAAVPVLEAPKVPAEPVAFLDGPSDAKPMPRVMRQEVSRLQGYTGDDCQTCGNFTMVRNGTCLKCDSCGATSGCS